MNNCIGHITCISFMNIISKGKNNCIKTPSSIAKQPCIVRKCVTFSLILFNNEAYPRSNTPPIDHFSFVNLSWNWPFACFHSRPYIYRVMHECVVRIHAWLVLPPTKFLCISMWEFVVARQSKFWHAKSDVSTTTKKPV